MGTLHEGIYAHLWYLTEFFLEWEMFQAQFVEKIKTHILCSVTFFPKIVSLWDNVEKYCRTRQATSDSIAYAFCIPDN